MEPTPVKMKMADPEQVTSVMVAAIQEWDWADELLRQHAPGLVHEINRALVGIGCVMIQPDLDASTM